MSELAAIELKANLPARDFDLSRQFYKDLGFTECWRNGGLAYFHYGPCGDHGKVAFLLQDYHVKEVAENLQMHMLVNDVDAWWKHLDAIELAQKYGVPMSVLEDREWGMRDFTVHDPSGVVWCFARYIE